MIIWIVEFTNSKNKEDLLHWGIEFYSKNEALAFIKRELSAENRKYRYAALYSNNMLTDTFSKPTYFDSECF